MAFWATLWLAAESRRRSFRRVVMSGHWFGRSYGWYLYMKALLWRFAPALLVLTGALLAAIGSFWSAFRQSHFNAEIRAKNEKIVTLQDESIRTLRSSDVCSFMVIINRPDKLGRFRLVAINQNTLPVYDVTISIITHDDSGLLETMEQWQLLRQRTDDSIQKVDVGTLPFGMTDLDVFLQPGRYQIDIRTRYEKYTEMISFGQFKGTYGQSWIVRDLRGRVLSQATSPEGFPPVP